jgi:putative tricarboxylic transport membrane protein
MSEGIKSPAGTRAGGLGGDTQELIRRLVPVGLAIFAFWSAWRLPGLSGVSTLLWISGALLVAAAVALFVLNLRIPNPQDYYGGLVLIGVALFAFWAGADLPGMRGFSFGPGTAPRLFAGMLLAFGVVITALGVFTEGQALERYAFRGPIFVAGAILFFAASIRPLGLIISSFVAFMIGAAGSTETRWWEALLMAVAITAFCTFLFPYALNLPFQLWPRFWY